MTRHSALAHHLTGHTTLHGRPTANSFYTAHQTAQNGC